MNLSIEDRLTQLERSNRRWRGAFVALLVLLGAGLVIAAAQPAPAPAEIIQARRFELIDRHGHPAIVMQTKDDEASLAVWGPDHQFAAVLVGQARKSGLMLMKGMDTPEVFAEAVEQGGQLGVTDGRSPAKAGADRAALNMSGGPTGFGIFHIVNGRPESLLSFSKSGGGLELRTPGGKAVTRIIGADAGGRIQILNREGQIVWEAPAAEK